MKKLLVAIFLVSLVAGRSTYSEQSMAEEKTFSGSIRLILPEVIYAVPKVEMNVYFDKPPHQYFTGEIWFGQGSEVVIWRGLYGLVGAEAVRHLFEGHRFRLERPAEHSSAYYAKKNSLDPQERIESAPIIRSSQSSRNHCC